MCRCSQRFQCVSNPHQSVSRPQLGTQPEFLKRGSAHDPRERRTNRQNASFDSRAMPRERRFYRFFFVACHCRDWNTVAIRDGMGYPLTRLPLLQLDDKTSSSLGYPHMSSSSIASHSSRGSVYALGVTTCSCGFVLGSSSSTISQPRRASPLGVMPIISA